MDLLVLEIVVALYRLEIQVAFYCFCSILTGFSKSCDFLM